MSEVPLWLWPLLGGLLLASGCFSASETALFSLTPSERLRIGGTAQALLLQPRRLLVAVLLGNLVVNLLFFAFAQRLFPGDGGRGDLAVGAAMLCVLLFGGEILPKSVGLRARVPVARFGAPLLRFVLFGVRPIQRPLLRLVDLLVRPLGDWGREESALTPAELAELFERIAAEGTLLAQEADLLGEIVELRGIRVREIMTPRVDLLLLDKSGENREEVVKRALEKRLSWLAVIDGNPDSIVGRVHVRDLVAYPERSPAQLVMPVKFVPEVASCQDLLRSLREDRATEAVVVDEWGGTAGSVTIEDVFEEIVGDLRTEGESREQLAVPLGEARYRVAGGLSIRDWNEYFGFRVVPTEFETIGGFVLAELGRIPRVGDEVRYGNLVLEVHEVRGRRVLSVDMRVEPEVAAKR